MQVKEPTSCERDQKRQNLKTLVRGAYDIQKLRIMGGNRIVANFKAKLGQQPSAPESEIDAEGQNILANMRARFKKITDGVKTFPRQATFEGDEVISDYTELCLVASYLELEKHEDQHFRRLGNILKEYPIWTEFLEGVRGVGPAMAGVIISEFDIHKARYPSSLWKYAGLDVASDGRGRSKKKEHLVRVEYTDKDGKPAERDSITFNPFIKTKLVGVLATSFLRTSTWTDADTETWNAVREDMRRDKTPGGKKVQQILIVESPYAQAFYDYRHRLRNHVDHQDKTDGHRLNMAKRYMIKRFLADLYREWRTLECLPLSAEYSEGKLGHRHGDAA